MQAPQEQIATVTDLFKGAGNRIAHRSLLKRYPKQCHVTRRYGIAQFIDDLVTLFRWTRMPRLLSMGGDCLCVEFDLGIGEILTSDPVDLFVNPVDLALEDRDSAQDKIFVLCAIRVARFVNVEQVHLFSRAEAKKK
jgi:hypothetical protein